MKKLVLVSMCYSMLIGASATALHIITPHPQNVQEQQAYAIAHMRDQYMSLKVKNTGTVIWQTREGYCTIPKASDLAEQFKLNVEIDTFKKIRKVVESYNQQNKIILTDQLLRYCVYVQDKGYRVEKVEFPQAKK